MLAYVQLALVLADSNINGITIGIGVIVGGFVGALIGMAKGRVFVGLILGALLGCIGWIIIALIPRKERF